MNFLFQENVLVSQKDQRLLSHPDLNTLRPQSPDPHLTHPTASLEEQLHQSTGGGPSSSKRRSSEAEEEEVTLPKRACLQRSSLPSVISGISDCEMELQRRRQQQEEEDRRLALVLQKELDEEERKRAIDRRKGSTDAYPLRQSCQAKEEDSSSSSTTRKLSTLISAPKTPTNSYSGPKNCTTSTSTPKTSTISSSGPSSSRGSKQTTLTEMFSSISSWSLHTFKSEVETLIQHDYVLISFYFSYHGDNTYNTGRTVVFLLRVTSTCSL